ncbi:predicted protein [Histoplasma capsulatum var. duboisii H88]|uniref:Predicted protein n=1 Tax=Ajellomyces capsulatus (strain H88) TaxID=544711 RepID=F0UG31_AJEC8|nr:predicted protein [Histoplasma capsulatum var. duboisii H88]
MFPSIRIIYNLVPRQTNHLSTYAGHLYSIWGGNSTPHCVLLGRLSVPGQECVKNNTFRRSKGHPDGTPHPGSQAERPRGTGKLKPILAFYLGMTGAAVAWRSYRAPTPAGRLEQNPTKEVEHLQKTTISETPCGDLLSLLHAKLLQREERRCLALAKILQQAAFVIIE